MKKILLIIAMAFLVLSPQAKAQGQMALANSPAYESAAYALRSAPARQYSFSKAVLSDVMRLIAEDAGIGFFGLPDGIAGSDSLVTFTIQSSPFTALETLAKANGISLIFESGIWYLRPANDQELIGRIYEINYNAQELVTKNTQASMSSGGNGNGSGNNGPSSGLNLQGSPDFFVTEPSRILEDIKNILNIPTTSGSASFAPTASVDTVAQLSLASIPGQPNIVMATPQGGGGAEGGSKATVIWNSDSNTLYVVASRQQHQWIEAYLASADRPQPMIAVEVKFIETSRDPNSEIGIDWTGVLGENGLEIGLSESSSAVDLGNIGGSYSLPTAVLSYSALNLKLRALYQDSRTKSVSYPRMVTLDNREVSFRSVINQPVLGSSASTSMGAGATQTSSVEYLPIGTVINVLPKRMAGNKILLNVSVTVSDIVGTEVINGNPYPIATSRVYTAPLTVKSGYTVAISGLDAAKDSERETGVPILGRLPVVGGAFRTKNHKDTRQHLMMLITPIALNSGTEGLTERPVVNEPWNQVSPSYGKEPVDYTAPSASLSVPVRAMPVEEVSDVPEFRDPATERKTNQTFGKKSERIPEPAPVSEVAVGASASEPANTPMTVDPKPAAPAPEKTPAAPTPEKTAAAPQPEADKTPAPAESKHAAQVAKIQSSVTELKASLAKIPEGDAKLSPDDAQSVVNVFESTQKLLTEVESVREDKSQPLVGELGEAWWDLINLKTQAVKLSRRSPESLAVSLDGEKKE